jgi:neopullulanase
MRVIPRLHFSLLAIALFAWAAAAQTHPFPSVTAQPLSITKVEPPNWWAGMPQNPMLLVSGAGLAGASAEARYPGVQVNRVESQAAGHYLFVWLKLSSEVKPGTVVVHIKRANGGLSAINFPLLPRSEHQPAGVSRDDVIYLIMPDRFADGNTANDNPPDSPGQTDRNQPRKWHGGDIKGITDHLAYLKQLGVTTLWLTPWWKQASSTSDYHGYHPVDFYAVDPHLGTMQELQQMTAKAHALGMKVIIDYVANHTGPLHPWAQDPPSPSWLHGTPRHHEHFDYDFAQLVDPHAVPRQFRPVLEGWFADSLPDLNPDDPRVEAYLRDNALWWTEMGALDGFRLDTFPYSSRRFWQSWHKDMRNVYPNLWTLGEVSNTDPWITSYFVGGRSQNDGIDTGVTTVFDFPLASAIRDATLHNGDAREIVTVLQHDSLYPDSGRLVTFIGNHDMRRYMSEQGATIDRLKAALSLLLTLRGVPQLYAGDEIAMPGGDDPDNRRDFPGGFSGDLRNAFAADGRTPQEQSVFTCLQQLLRLRREHPALTKGTLHHISVAADHYVFLRESTDDRILVVFNSAATAQTLSLPLAETPLESAQQLEPLFDAAQARIRNGHAEVPVKATTVSIYRVR